MIKRAALIAFLTALHFSLLGLATALGQTTPNDLLAFHSGEQRIPCGVEARPVNRAIADISHQLFCNLTDVEQLAFFAGWSPDGTRAAFEVDGGMVIINDAQMREVTRLEQAYSPSWSVNGILVFSNDVGNIFTVDRNGNNRQFLTSGGITGTNPRWSLDGRRVVFGCDFEICIVDANGENLRTVDRSSETVELEQGSFDSGEILIVEYGLMYIIDVEAAQMRRVFRDYAIIGLPRFSYDGRRVAFFIDTGSGKLSIMVISLEDASEHPLFSALPSPSVIYDTVGWSPDGRQLVFDIGTLYVADLRSGGVRQVCACAYPRWVPNLALYTMITEP